MSCLTRPYRKVLAATRRLDPTLAGTVRDEILSACDDRDIDEISWE